MADKKSIERALKTVGKACSRSSSGRFYLHIDWKRRLISLHMGDSPELDRLAYDDEIPDTACEVFGETGDGLWKGHFGSFIEALGYSKLLNDVHHKQAGEYMLIDYAGTARGEKPEPAHAV